MNIDQDLPPIDSTDADRLRGLLERAGLSQRAAAKVLNIEERTMRDWCAGKGKPPASVFRALSPRLTHVEHLQRLIDSNERTIEAMSDGRITGLGYGPTLAGPDSLAIEIDRLRKQNEQHRALLRLDRAFHRQQAAFVDLTSQGTPHGDGVLADESMSEAKVAQQEFREAKAEVDRLTKNLWHENAEGRQKS